MSADVLVIQLWPRETECIACGEPLVNCRRGIPVYESESLPNDYVERERAAGRPAEWGGFDACDPCFDAQATLTDPTPLRELARLAGKEPRC